MAANVTAIKFADTGRIFWQLVFDSDPGERGAEPLPTSAREGWRGMVRAAQRPPF